MSETIARGGAGGTGLVPDSVVGKVGVLLEALNSLGPVRLSTLARETGLPKSTVRRLISELAEWGLVEYQGSDIVLGYRLSELGRGVWSRDRLRDLIRPYAVDFYATHGHRVTVVVPHQKDIVVVDTVSGTGMSVLSLPIGTRAPMYATAGGKSILAYSSTQQFQAATAGPLKRFTPRTICVRHLLALELQKVRKTGYAVTRGESASGSNAFAVPVFDSAGRPIAALAVPFTSSSVPMDVVSVLRSQAQLVTRRIAAGSAGRRA